MMSLKTWKQEYYRRSARATSKAKAIEHSLTKWEGLRDKNLKRHGLRWDSYGAAIVDDVNSLWIDQGSCALCRHYYIEDEVLDGCETCPLAITRGGVSCDDARDDEASSPYRQMLHDENALPMIKWLKKTLKVSK